MLDLDVQPLPDRRPGVVICAYDAADDLWSPYDEMGVDYWNPPGARSVPVDGGETEALADTLVAHVRGRDCDALLLIGRTRKGSDFRVQMRVENRGLNTHKRLSVVGPGVARSTAPVSEMVRALTDLGLPAEASSEAEDDAGSYLLYRLLAALPDDPDAPAVGLLRVPMDADDRDVRKAIQAVASSMAMRLSHRPR